MLSEEKRRNRTGGKVKYPAKLAPVGILIEREVAVVHDEVERSILVRVETELVADPDQVLLAFPSVHRKCPDERGLS